MALDFTLLTAEQIWGEKDGSGQLEVMKKYGTVVKPTDLAVILGGDTSDFPTLDGEYTCCAWTTSDREKVQVYCVGYSGGKGWERPVVHSVPARPTLPPFETEKLTPYGRKIVENGVEIIEYGEYPQMLANEDISAQLEKLYQSQSLHPTGKSYTYDWYDQNHCDTRFRETPYSEYELDGKKYIRVPGRRVHFDRHLSDGEKVKGGKPYWVEVQPIEWLMDKSGWMVSKKCLFAGIQFDTQLWYDGDFSKTFMKKYLDNYFAKEMGHDEQEKQKQKRDKVLTGLSAQLKQATNGEAVKAIEERLKLAEKGKKVQTAPERLHEAAMIKRLKKARDILLKAHTEAQEKGDDELADSIVDLARPYSARYAVQQKKVRYRRAKRKQGDRG